MSLTLLTGTISSIALNNNFVDKVATINSNNTNAQLSLKDFSYDLEVFDFSNTSTAGLGILDFTPPDDVELRVIGYSIYSASAVPLLTLTLTTIDIDGTAAPLYLLNQTISITNQSVVGEAVATRDDRQDSSTTKIFLKKGVTCRLQLTSASATAADHITITLYCRSRRRRA